MLARLVTIQRRENLTDAQMAARLGISRSMWTLIRGDRYRLSGDVAITAAGVWPELMGDLLERARVAGERVREGVTA